MAPRHEHAVATAVSTQVLSHDESSVLVEAGGIMPTCWFMSRASQPEKPEEDPSRPPIKKRKTNVERAEHRYHPDVTLDEAKHIPVARAVVDLHFPQTLKERPVKAEDIVEDVDFTDSESIGVVPAVVNLFEEGTRLRMSLTRKKSEVLIVDTAGLPESAVDFIRKVVISRLQKTTKGSGDHPATWCKCTLTPSKGQLYTVVRFEATVFWRSGDSAFPAGVPVGKPRVYHDYDLLLEAFPGELKEERDHTQIWTPQDFFESVHVPQKNSEDSDGDRYFDTVLDTELFPFQKRAVRWMLRREGRQFVGEQLQHVRTTAKTQDLGYFREDKDLDGRQCFVNHLQGIMQREPPEDSYDGLSGGILAEEMGLGKTVEVMTLLSLNRRLEPLPAPALDHEASFYVYPSKATLIIAPNSILWQWKVELRRHAPALKVFHYEGVTSRRTRAFGDEPLTEAELLKALATQYDVVLATYPTLAHDLHFAEDPPKRDMRRARKYERKRSPLVQIQWWRICLDEAQMVESGVSAAARVARRLPRVHSWAVSGTPLRKSVEDLHGLLIFLNYQPFCDDGKIWSHMLVNHMHLFRKIFSSIALRHTKAQVRDELHLPQQKRVVITMPFSAVEHQRYSQLFSEMCHDVGVNTDGSPRRDDWDPQDTFTIEQMRSWLVRLRQSCLHPEVGAKNRMMLGRSKGPIRTVEEVLEVMIDSNENEIRTVERTLLGTQLTRAHVIGNNLEDQRRSEKALVIYTAAMERSAELVQDARKKLAAARQAHADNDGTATDTEDESGNESTPVLGRMRNNLRAALQLLHTCTFFAATACYQIKSNIEITEPESDRFNELEQQETSLYEKAKLLRKEVLSASSRKAEGHMRKIASMLEHKTFVNMPKIHDLESWGGIESRRVVEKADDLFTKLREQCKLVTEWRAKMAEYLLKPLVDKDEGIETTGDEYEDSTKIQDELYVYFDAVKAMQADLNTFVTGEAAPLIDVEVKAQIKAAKSYLDPDVVDDMKAVVHAPELALKLLGMRNELRGPRGDFPSIRGLIQETRALEFALEGSEGSVRAAERLIAQKHLKALQSILSTFTKALKGLGEEVDLFRDTQNQRLEFYRQLQEISDDVEPYKEELDKTLDVERLETLTAREAVESKSLKALNMRHTYLLTLRQENAGTAEHRTCTICLSIFEHGTMTVCGHTYCRECLQHWFKSNPGHRSCPQCRRQLSRSEWFNVSFKQQELKGREEGQTHTSSPSNTSSSSSRPDSIYSDIDSLILQEIKAIDLPTSYGTKIDTLGKHLLWIREHDPGAKAIVFSQYKEFLDVLEAALRTFKVGTTRLGRHGALERFRRDPSVDALLLDAKTDSSGMTLVNATHVFICEPLIQTAVELQAIARVHRIGQTRPTTVWMYLINDTVEESIYEISVARRLAYVQARQANKAQKSRSTTPAPLQENAIDAANSEQLQSAPLSKFLVSGKGGGELVGNEDLWQCLFGKAQQGTAAKEIVAEEPEVQRYFRAEAAERRRVVDVMDVD